MSKLDEKILNSEIKKHNKTKKKLEKKIKEVENFEKHNEFIMKCMFGEINALKGLKGESKKWTDSQLDGMIYILEKHLFTFLDETEVFGAITDEIYEWWKGHKPHDFYVSEYTKELNEINKRLNELEENQPVLNNKDLWDYVHKLAKDVNHHRLVLWRYQKENKLTETVLLNEETYSNEQTLPITSSGTGIEYLNNQIKIEA